MLNVIWLFMIVVAVVVAGFNGSVDAVTAGAFAAAKTAVMEVALPLIGLWAIWLGMMRVAEKAGLVQLLSRALRPIMRRLFPDVPADHPAQGAMVLNMAANMLGLGNSATPMGLRAMALLEKLNPRPGVASNAMVTFLAVNTASIQLIPTTAISILAGQNAKSPSDIILPALFATAAAMTCGVLAAKLLAPFFPVPAEEGSGVANEIPADEAAVIAEEPPAITRRGVISLILLFGFFGLVFTFVVWPSWADEVLSFIDPSWHYPRLWPDVAKIGERMIRAASVLAVPFLLVFFPLYGWLRDVRVYEQFCEGAREAFGTAQRIIPYLVAMLVAIAMLRAAGVIEYITLKLAPVFNAIGFPADLLPLALMRPLSGSASSGIFVDLVKTHGADSLVAKTAATIYGSTETTFYVLAVYFGSVAIRKFRHAVAVGLIADLVAIAVAVAICRWRFS